VDIWILLQCGAAGGEPKVEAVEPRFTWKNLHYMEIAVVIILQLC